MLRNNSDKNENKISVTALEGIVHKSRSPDESNNTARKFDQPRERTFPPKKGQKPARHRSEKKRKR